MSRSRAVSLLVLVGVLLAGAVGLSHVGHATVTGTCNNRTWAVVLGHAADTGDIAVFNQRAGKLVPNDCFASLRDPNGGYLAVSQFTSQPDAQQYLDAIVKAGWTQKYGYQPTIVSTR